MCWAGVCVLACGEGGRPVGDDGVEVSLAGVCGGGGGLMRDESVVSK